MMRYFAVFLFLPIVGFCQSSMDNYRWYLNPTGQEILISIDDLYDERIPALPSMNWGRESIAQVELKKDIVIAVIDGGIDIDHPELKDRIAYNSVECFNGTTIPPKGEDDFDKNGYKGDCAGWDFVENTNRPEDMDGHGTHVTGVINSVLNGVKGNYKFLPLRVFAPDEGRQTVKASAPLPVRLTKAFEYALSRNVDVIHLSVGWPKSFLSFELEQVIKKAIEKGVLIVSAAGNSSQRATIFPCQMEGVICVGALRPNGDVARFSNWGSQVDLFAPGEKILSTIPLRLAPLHISRKGYDFKNGTSQAAPFLSAAVALLRGVFPEENREAIYSRLMITANSSKNEKGLKGLFHLDKSLNLSPTSFVYPQLKGLHSVVIKDSSFSLALPIKNFWAATKNETQVSLTCDEASLDRPVQIVPALGGLETVVLNYEGQFQTNSNYLNCKILVGRETVFVKMKVLHKLNTPQKEVVVKQDELLVVNTRSGARSRFLTMNAIKGTVAGPFYYVASDKSVTFYREGQILGKPNLPTGCGFLRAWQVDYDHDQKNELMVEALCDKEYLFYQFLDLNLKEIFPSVRYKPSLTIVNYDDFEVITQKDLPPVFRFMNLGFIEPTDSPWDSDVSTRENHLYELTPVKNGEGFKFNVKVMEETEKWKLSLGLRYMPSYQVMHQLGGKLLVKIGLKTAWVDIKTQTATWADLDNVLLLGSKKQDLIGTKESILQSFLTPFEYRGFLLNGVSLRFIQTNKFDPLLDILGTQKTPTGFKTVLRSFQQLIYLEYDLKGNLIKRQESVVDRFDFLTAQDLISSVVSLSSLGDMLQIVDGTKVNTNYVDLMVDGELTSYEIPAECVTQNPIYLEGAPTLPVFCAQSRAEFEMRFIKLVQ